MKNFSNTYTFLYISAVVIITAAILSFIAEQLRPLQEKNIEIETKQDILRSVGRAQDPEGLRDKMNYIETEFKEYINNSIVINHLGEVVEDRDAFEITKNLKAELAKPVEKRGMPLFVYSKSVDEIIYIAPLLGRGLWGQIWGYIALENDLSTIYGAVFDHAKETPGLGAEINTEWFQEKFSGKNIFDPSGEFVSLDVVKGGADPANVHQVDAISGGTITSVGLQEMLYEGLKPYEAYFKKHKKN